VTIGPAFENITQLLGAINKHANTCEYDAENTGKNSQKVEILKIKLAT